jgi:hypothetical protein
MTWGTGYMHPRTHALILIELRSGHEQKRATHEGRPIKVCGAPYCLPSTVAHTLETETSTGGFGVHLWGFPHYTKRRISAASLVIPAPGPAATDDLGAPADITRARQDAVAYFSGVAVVAVVLHAPDATK